jgi:hypothetical protein
LLAIVPALVPAASIHSAAATSATATASIATAAATSATTASIATAASTTSTASTTPVLARPGFVYGQGPTAILGAIEGIDRLLRLAIILHFHKAEAARPAGLAVGDHLGAGHCAMFLEHGQQVVGGRFPCQIADVDIFRHFKNLSVPGPQQQTHWTRSD